MSPKLKFALICRYSDRGFALPIAISLGFIILLVVATLLMRSQGDQLTAAVQKNTAESLTIGETGVTRTQSFFKKYPSLTLKRYDSTTSPIVDEWSSMFTTSASGATCNAGSSPVPALIGASGTNGWISVTGFGHFKILKYTPDTPSTGIGTLEILGTPDQNATTLQSTNKPQGAISPISVQIPYGTTPGAAINPPGLWAATLGGVSGSKSIGQTQQDINGNVLTQDCDATSFDTSNNFPSGNPNGWTVSPRPDIRFPSLPTLPSHVASRAAVTTLGTGSVTLPDDFPGISPDPGTTDTYSYLVPSISVDSLTVSSGKKVRLYVQGNIDLRGNAGISSETNSLQIYGSNAAGTNGAVVNYRLNSDTTGSYTTSEIGLTGNANIYGFIFAPAAIAGVKGGGTSGGFNGSLWIRAWVGASFGSNSNHTVVNVPSNFNWGLLPTTLQSGAGLPGQIIQPITEWQRKEAP